MSDENDFTRRVERIAASMDIDAKCRLMHRDGFEDDGEWFPPYDEYEVRASGRILTIDEALARWDPAKIDSLIRIELRAVFGDP